MISKIWLPVTSSEAPKKATKKTQSSRPQSKMHQMMKMMWTTTRQSTIALNQPHQDISMIVMEMKWLRRQSMVKIWWVSSLNNDSLLSMSWMSKNAKCSRKKARVGKKDGAQQATAKKGKKKSNKKSVNMLSLLHDHWNTHLSPCRHPLQPTWCLRLKIQVMNLMEHQHWSG